MRLALREDMTLGTTLPDQLAWLERRRFTTGSSSTRPRSTCRRRELRAIFADSPVPPPTSRGRPLLLHPDPPRAPRGWNRPGNA